MTVSDRLIQPPDLEIRVKVERAGRNTRLIYSLHSPNGATDFHYKEIDGPTLQGSPEEFYANLLSKIEKLDAGVDFEGEFGLRNEARVESLGRRLWQELFSPEMRRAYRRFRDRVRTLLIVTDESWIPWELIKPYDDEEDLIDDAFLAERFEVTRWLVGRNAPPAEIRVSQLAFVEAGNTPKVRPLPHAAEERAQFTDLARTQGIEDASPSPATFEAIEALLAGGRVGILHVLDHGNISPSYPEEASLLLEDGHVLWAEDIQAHIKTGIRKSRPLVFLNVYRIGQQSWARSA